MERNRAFANKLVEVLVRLVQDLLDQVRWVGSDVEPCVHPHRDHLPQPVAMAL